MSAGSPHPRPLRSGSIEAIDGRVLYTYRELAHDVGVGIETRCALCSWRRRFSTILGAEETTHQHLRSVHRVKLVSVAEETRRRGSVLERDTKGGTR